jgi:hypothetical protein
MTLRLYRPATGRTFALIPQYDPAAGATGCFALNGMSVVSGLKADAAGPENASQNNISIYPNPTRGMLFVDGISSATDIEITNAAGQMIFTTHTNDNISINMSSRPAGMYTVKLISDQSILIRNIMVK